MWSSLGFLKRKKKLPRARASQSDCHDLILTVSSVAWAAGPRKERPFRTTQLGMERTSKAHDFWDLCFCCIRLDTIGYAWISRKGLRNSSTLTQFLNTAKHHLWVHRFLHKRTACLHRFRFWPSFKFLAGKLIFLSLGQNYLRKEPVLAQNGIAVGSKVVLGRHWAKLPMPHLNCFSKMWWSPAHLEAQLV